MEKLHYYTDGVNEDLIYQMPIFFYAGVKMSTTTFNSMLGRPTLGQSVKITLERIDEEDILYMKKRGSLKDGLVRIPYPNILSNLIINNQCKLIPDDSFNVP